MAVFGVTADAYNGVFLMVGSTLAFIKTFNTASATVELFEGPAPYTAAPTVATTTGFNSHDGSNGWFRLDGKGSAELRAAGSRWLNEPTAL